MYMHAWTGKCGGGAGANSVALGLFFHIYKGSRGDTQPAYGKFDQPSQCYSKPNQIYKLNSNQLLNNGAWNRRMFNREHAHQGGEE